MRSISHLFLPIFILVSINLNSQNNFDYKKYRSYLNKARMEKFKQNYKLEKKYYNKCFKYGNEFLPSAIELEEYAVCLLNNSDTTNALYVIKKILVMTDVVSYNTGYIFSKLPKRDSVLLFEQLDDFKKEYEKRILIKNPSILITRELERIDQEVRAQKNTMDAKEFYQLLEYTDSINHYELYNLSKEKGANPMCFLLYHLYDKNQKYVNYYDSILKLKIYTGEVTAEGYITWYDRQRVYVRHEKTQLYGEWNPEGSKEFYPIENIAEIDKRRKAIGLCTLKEYAKINEMNLPKDYIYESKKRRFEPNKR